MTTRKERLHRIWQKLEHIADELGEALEDARNQEQIEILREQTGIADLLHEVSGLLLKIQQSPQNNVDGLGMHYVTYLGTNEIDALAEEIREILDNGLQAGSER